MKLFKIRKQLEESTRELVKSREKQQEQNDALLEKIDLIMRSALLEVIKK